MPADALFDDLLDRDGLTAEQARARYPEPPEPQEILQTVRAYAPARYHESTGGSATYDVVLRQVGLDHPLLDDWGLEEDEAPDEVWEIVRQPHCLTGLVLVFEEPDEHGNRFARITPGEDHMHHSPTLSEAVWCIVTGY